LRSSALAILGLLSACYTPAPANGAWTCSAGTHDCPSGYYCASNDTCWKNDTKDGGAKQDGGIDCAGSSAALCEDFESGKINASVWTMMTMNGQVSVDGVHAHRGSFALHAHTPFIQNASLGNAEITTDQVFPKLQSGFFVRVFVYIESPPPLIPDALVYAQRGTVDGMNFGLDSGDVQIYDIDLDNSEQSSTAMPVGTWTCLEWSLDGDSSKVWLNGNQVHDIDYMGSSHGPYVSLSFGTSLFQPNAQAATDLWVDDIIVDTSQIGCSR
jgi:hypothetical protein